MRRDEQRLSDILEALDWIAKAVSGRTEDDFVTDETLCYAVAQRLTTFPLRLHQYQTILELRAAVGCKALILWERKSWKR
jgi:hypothetical protein